LSSHVVFLLYTNVSKEYTVSIFKVEARRDEKLMIYIGLGGPSRHRDWPKNE
jgi:hypothetical protein